MKAYSLQVQGSRVELKLGEVPVPQAGAGQVLVKMHAAALNRGELIPGGLAKPGPAKPAGGEGAGRIAALGAGVTGLAEGDAVMGRCNGAFAEYALMDAREAIPVPKGLSMTAAAAVPLSFFVVHDMLVLQGQLKAGEWLLVTGVSSGTGVAALQLAKALGARVIGTSGSADKLSRLQGMGLDVALHTRQPDFADAVLKATGGQGANLAVNTVGGTMFAECIRSLAFEGRMAIVGYVDNTLSAQIDLQTVHAKRLRLFGVSNKLRSADQKAAAVPEFKATLLPAIEDGRIQPLVDRVFKFDELLAAQAAMEDNQHLGKLVLQIAD